MRVFSKLGRSEAVRETVKCTQKHLSRPYRSAEFMGVRPQVDPTAFVAESADLSGAVSIGANSGIWFGCVLRGDVSYIRIGQGTNIQDGSVIHCDSGGVLGDPSTQNPTIIGDNVTVGHMALLHACTVEDRAFIGMRATVMDRAVIESEAVIAAGALVTMGKRVPSRELWAGVPAKFVRKVSDEEISEMQKRCKNYETLAEEFRLRSNPEIVE